MGTHNCTIINQGGKREGKNNPSCHTMAKMNQQTLMHHPMDNGYDSVVDD